MATTDLIAKIIFQDRSMVFAEPDKEDKFSEFAEYARKQFNIDPSLDFYPNPITKNFRNKKIKDIQDKGVLEINLISKFEQIEETSESTTCEEKSFLSDNTDEDAEQIIRESQYYIAEQDP
ncbi:hypothetical protein TVAG_215110 [Trichomonas vaginalis G3]|uniref:Uncharacterized protein n=1 Tax=Trichomonas vaginalis (strain ATCC PRA-98 / G3) TaxID=412133 RepID=A2F641_TRIV3|nr:hypothetical protein TVAGG3_0363820 [Trichomonas vaginalis G3]EAX99611.1 hypothetical protein TVAG_215110 [Trichomonas vaginalis G3]KAI5532127.1 hypothetical protein TVAGG3_0363820 [Trichomonas vaginalis G3]|eukprot:XP_001312541.1 hypothetical protein [Trichomonas vaginalis G3]